MGVLDFIYCSRELVLFKPIVLISSFLFASIIFLIIDILWLSYSVKVFYRPQLGSLLLDKPILWAAIVFYLGYLTLISIPFIIVLFLKLAKENLINVCRN